MFPSLHAPQAFIDKIILYLKRYADNTEVT